MLQQTQIATVLGRGFYFRFLQSFPTVEALAAAEDEPLLKAWEGLGYYRRARMLRDTAKAVITRFSGRFPDDPDELLSLPGVGKYTVGAIRSFAFNLPAALVDGNVMRVLSRLMDYRDPVDSTTGQKWMWNLAGILADPNRPRSFNAGLMELGQTICRPGVPDCLSCPVAGFCRTREPEALPVKGKKIEITGVDEHALWVRDSRGRVLLHREISRRREGLWRLPIRELADVSRFPVKVSFRYAITRYQVTLRVYDAGISPDPAGISREGDEWQDPESLSTLPMAAPFRRAVEEMLEGPEKLV